MDAPKRNLLAVTAVLCIAAAVAGVNRKKSPEENWKTCSENMNAILAPAIASYAEDHGRQYPPSLEALVPKYIAKLPVCPEAGRDTYSDVYKVLPDGQYPLFCSAHPSMTSQPHLIRHLERAPDL